MKVDTSQAQLQQSNQEMFRVIQQAQQTNQEMSDKMIRLSIEQKVAHQKEQIVDNMVDIFL